MAKEEATLIIKMKDLATKPMKGLKKAFSGIVVTAGDVVGALKSIGGAALNMAKQAGQYDSVSRAFRAMAANQGQDADMMLSKMRELSAGTVSDLKLMQQANTALLLGLPVDKFGDMVEIARSASQATGQSMEFMLNSIVTGLGRGSKLVLDNLGIVFKLEDAYTEYARTLGVTASQLTEAEKKQAFINKALETGKANAKAAGEVQLTLNERLQQVSASMDNAAVSAGKSLGPAIEFVLDKFVLFQDAMVSIAQSDVFAGFIKGAITVVNTFGVRIASITANAVTRFETLGSMISAVMDGEFKQVLSIAKGHSAKMLEIEKATNEQLLADKKALNERFAQNDQINKEQELARLKAHKQKLAIEEEIAGFDREEKAAERDQVAFMAETERLVASDEEKLALKIKALDKQLATETNHSAKMKLLKDKQSLLDQDREAKLAAFQKTQDDKTRSERSKHLGVMSSLSQSSNHALASIGKAAGITRIAINTPIAVSEAFAAFPPPLNFIAASAVGAAMASQAAQIAGVQLADGGIIPQTPGGIQATIGEGDRAEAVIPLPDDFDPDQGVGGGGNTFIFNGPVLGNEDQAQEFAKAIDRELLVLRQNNESIAFDEDVI